MKLIRTLLVISFIVYSLYFMYSSFISFFTKTVSLGYETEILAEENCIDGTVLTLYRNNKIVGYGCERISPNEHEEFK